MSANDARTQSKGTIYSWAKSHRFVAWFSGFCLASTGIIATSGLAVVAAEYGTGFFLPKNDGILSTILPFLIAVALIIGAGRLSSSSLKLTSAIQNVGIGIQIAALIYSGYLVLTSDRIFQSVSGSPMDWIHGILLATFAYWGFDAAFALTEETDVKNPQKASLASILSMAFLFSVMALALASDSAESILSSPLVSIAIVFASVLSLGSTMLPAIRGLEAMSENSELPQFLSSSFRIEMFVIVLASLWSFFSILFSGFFWDSVESLSVLVGIYFSVSLYVSWQESSEDRKLFGVGFLLMSSIAVTTFIQSFSTNYGETSLYSIGGVALITLGLGILGAVLTVIYSKEFSDDALSF